MNTDKPVVGAAQITAAVAAVWPAFLVLCAAFDWWDPTQEQTAAITGLWGAITVAVGLIGGKVAASRVFVASHAQALADESHEKAHAEDAERVRIAESFGRPDQTNDMPHPTGEPIGGRQDWADPDGKRAGRPPL